MSLHDIAHEVVLDRARAMREDNKGKLERIAQRRARALAEDDPYERRIPDFTKEICQAVEDRIKALEPEARYAVRFIEHTPNIADVLGPELDKLHGKKRQRQIVSHAMRILENVESYSQNSGVILVSYSKGCTSWVYEEELGLISVKEIWRGRYRLSLTAKGREHARGYKACKSH